MKSLRANQPVVLPEIDEDVVGVYGELIDFNEDFKSVTDPIYLQETVDPITGSRTLEEAVYTMINSSESIDPIPSCEYGCTKYEEHLGEVCPTCGTKVEYPSERSLTPTMWMRKSPLISKYINPYVYSGLKSAFNLGTNKKPYNPFLLCLENKAVDSSEHRAVIAGLDPAIGLGYNAIAKNLKVFIEALAKRVLDLNADRIFRLKEARINEILDVLDMLRFPPEMMTSDVLPVRSSLLMILEESNNSTRTESTQLYGEALTYILKVPMSSKMPNWKVETLMCKFYSKLDENYTEYVRREGKKGGGIRSEPIGGRSSFGMRCVITQNVLEQNGDDLLLPYAPTIVAWHPYVVRSYTADGYSLKETYEIINKYTRTYNEDMHRRLTEINASFELGAITALCTRYPTLYRWSTTPLQVRAIKKDPEDYTLSVPAAILAAMNGDFDGGMICSVQ